MQRQSLGSPAMKQPLPPARGAEEDDDDGKKKWKKKMGGGAVEVDEAREEGEIRSSEKPFRRSSFAAPASPSGAASAGPERTIHIIPVLTLFCFLVLYLCSHDPAVTAAAATGGASAVVRSHRSLKELERIRGHHGSRRMGKRGPHL
ncbi:unnamed protein product [Spirodela intermedia]|uniref:Uncharacterized protein n=1 Tax=Spirodela intermedia TaxID=51605 RepID=A0A7I8JHL5_SPIIN|nr:unnamed protein product [Spirodela intermedia]CAA6669636.1 unnamed protein product [Spirodela intermedia]